MHLPVFSLFPCTSTRLGRLQRIFVNGFQREVEEMVFDLACIDIIFFDLGQRLTDVAGAIGSLVF
jgi:hypothetical protein